MSDISIRLMAAEPLAEPLTIAGRIEWIMWLLNPFDDDGRPLAPFITKEQARELLEAPSC